MKTSSPPKPNPRATWLAYVAAHPAAMSSRRLSTVETWPGGVKGTAALAKAKGVHLLLLEDDKGQTAGRRQHQAL
jgi:hypothetical protein